MEVSNLTKKRIEELLKKETRFDKRKPLEYREMIIETGISKNAEGSARVKLGDTEVLAGIKLDVMEPFTDTPENGALIVTAELLPMSSPKFESGPPSIQAIELARIIDRGIRESEFIDLKKLCIKKGELVWAVFLDIYPMNDDGNLIDAAALAAVAAIKTAVFPEIKEDKVQYGELTNKKLPLNEMPVTVTSYLVDDTFILDPVMAEEEAARCRVSIAITFDKDEFIHAMQKSGEDALTEKQIEEVLTIALREGKKLHVKILSQLKK